MIRHMHPLEVTLVPILQPCLDKGDYFSVNLGNARRLIGLVSIFIAMMPTIGDQFEWL